MGKSLYVFKMYILSHLYTRLTAGQERGITRLTLFIIALYGKYYLQSSHSSSALRLYLTLFYDFCIFFKIDPDIATLSEDICGIICQNLLFCLFLMKSSILITSSYHSQNMPSEFQQDRPDFENPNTVLRRDEKQSLADLSHSRLFGFCLNMQHFTL